MDEIKKLEDIIESSDNIVFFGGAGVSTESGVPDFRSENGIYNTVTEYGVNPETILSHSYFRRHPDVFFDFCRKYLSCEGIKPNAAHYALAKLEKRGKLKAVVTQNIDGLHQLAGSKNVLELHGTMLRYRCDDCGRQYPVKALPCKGVPHCDYCGGLVRPDIVMYEEPLDDEVCKKAIRAVSAADTLIIGGTSLCVYPAAAYVTYFRAKNLIIINRSPTPYDDRACLCINGKIGEVLGKATE